MNAPLLDLAPVLPELILAIGAMALLMFGVFTGEKSAGSVTVAGIVLLVVAAVAVTWIGGAPRLTFGGSFILDGFAKFMKVLAFVGAAAALLLSWDYFKREGIDRFEFPVLVLLSATGMGIMISANDLIALYMGLELMSLALYVIASFHRDNERSTEAGLKYFVLGALSSGMLLYGCSLIYGFTGTVSLPGIAAQIKTGTIGLGLIFGLVFLMAGLAFKISAVPFHMWTPDVYEGAPSPVTAFFAAGPKVAAMALFVRAMIDGFPTAAPQWQQIVVFVSIASMALGSFAAIGQSNIKRLMAYSSIGHMGFALVGLAAGTANGVQGVAIYIAIYMIMTLGTFACIIAMRRKEGSIETIDDLAGLSRTNPFMAAALAALLFSLAGIPPLAGFFAKFYVFAAAIEAKLYTLAVLGVLASVVGCYYYLRVVKLMYFDEPAAPFEPMATELKVVLAVSALFVVLFVVYPAPLVAAAGAAARSLF
ncbi:NADH-quinone oxidoreductase subunit NuoN [Phreatobacter stygius]|uniref:NADH-quinone oxidoreductase subunit N n=1 Tax=Phreatobacter stygius TaxID=1940610 RepID=A0A4D7B5H3_9HYPH|nr:NADH-quinone oxidoreductase subunit NuoN [Phreatobacter stygius]QCI68624.1 NADH-quinone oxidoreductase subunit NuoN [Phreatobacter stygius]